MRRREEEEMELQMEIGRDVLGEMRRDKGWEKVQHARDKVRGWSSGQAVLERNRERATEPERQLTLQRCDSSHGAAQHKQAGGCCQETELPSADFTHVVTAEAVVISQPCDRCFRQKQEGWFGDALSAVHPIAKL